MSTLLDPRAPRSLLAADDAVLSRAEAERVVQTVVSLKRLDGVAVAIRAGRTRNLRFAANQLSTAGVTEDAQATITAVAGRRRASVTTNDFTREGLERAVRKAEAIATLAPEDPEAMPLLGAQPYRELPAAYDEATASLDAAAAIAAATSALAPARAGKALEVAGFLLVSGSATVLGNSAGLFAYHRGSRANYTITARTADGTGSGWASDDAVAWSALDVAKTSARAIEKAMRSRNPVAIEPGRYTVVLEPTAVGDLVSLLGRYLQARAAEEGRSPFSRRGGGTRVGEQVVSPLVTLASDPADPAVLGTPFDGEGLPLARQAWIEQGVLRTLQRSRAWAARTGGTPTGGASSLLLGGGDASLDAMIAGTQRGILVTRFWYLREVDPRTALHTGLTRDGTFLIENGKVTKSIKNMRFNESPLFLLNNVEALGPAVRVGDGDGGPVTVMPSLRARDFSFTSLSDAV